MIYFIRSPQGPIKIGTTIRLSSRVKQLASEYGQGLEILAVMDGSYSEERKIHRKFHRLRRTGEWFDPGPDLMEFIATNGKPWDIANDEAPVATLSIKGDPAWRDWVAEAASHSRMSVPDYVDHALVYAARTEGFRPKPPARIR